MAMLTSKLIELEEQRRRDEIAKEKGEAQDVGWGSQIRSYVLHPYTMVKDHRTNVEVGNVQGVLDGDLDEFVRAELLRRAGKWRVLGRRLNPSGLQLRAMADERRIPRLRRGDSPSPPMAARRRRPGWTPPPTAAAHRRTSRR